MLLEKVFFGNVLIRGEKRKKWIDPKRAEQVEFTIDAETMSSCINNLKSRKHKAKNTMRSQVRAGRNNKHLNIKDSCQPIPFSEDHFLDTEQEASVSKDDGKPSSNNAVVEAVTQ